MTRLMLWKESYRLEKDAFTARIKGGILRAPTDEEAERRARMAGLLDWYETEGKRRRRRDG
jgi:hypothetical protein